MDQETSAVVQIAGKCENNRCKNWMLNLERSLQLRFQRTSIHLHYLQPRLSL